MSNGYETTVQLAHDIIDGPSYVINAPAKFEAATSDGLGGDAFTKKYIDLWP